MPRGRIRKVDQETPMDQALQLSAQRGAALPSELVDAGDEPEFDPAPPPYERRAVPQRLMEDDDVELQNLNNPDMDTFGEPPMLGANTGTSEMFGIEAQTLGRATSPKLYAQASQFPTAVQFRVWRWENGIPVGIGSIDAEATEDDFIRQFYGAMPKEGDGRFQFRLRPVDLRGKELGKEFTINISEHHAELTRMRKQREKKEESRPMANDPLIISQGSDSGGAYAEEMGRMFEQAVATAERRTDLLQSTLEEERNRLREEEKARYQERIAVASQSAEVVQKMTERLLETDRLRSQEQLKAQEGQSHLLLQTLTTVFSQQQAAARDQAERNRMADEAKIKQDREFFERQRQEDQIRRERERQELEAQRLRDREEYERKRQQEKEEADRRLAIERERLVLEQKRIEEQRKYELEQLRLEQERREREAARQREIEKAELDRKLERERLEMERQRLVAKEEQERLRLEIESRRALEKEEWERKRIAEREEAERRERSDRERIERERQDFQFRMEREKMEREEAMLRRKEELEREERRRKEEVELRLKQIEIEAQRARDHQERMAEQARLDREAQREAQERRDRIEREAREAADRERQRQHDMQLREMESAQQRDREHQERMLQLQRHAGGEGGGGGLGGLLESLGLEAPEILEKIFGGSKGGEEDSGWLSAVTKAIGPLAEFGKAALTAKAEQQRQIAAMSKRPRLPAGPMAQLIQTPEGPRMVMMPGASPAPVNIPLAHEAVETEVPPVQAKPAAPKQGKPFEAKAQEKSPAPKVEAASESKVTKSEEPVAPVTQTDLMTRARKAGMSLLDQKKARKALRQLAGKLETTDEADWLGILTEAVTSEISIYHYIKAVTVEAALTEATQNEELKARVIAAMRNSGMVPEDVPYTEEDYLKMSKGKG